MWSNDDDDDQQEQEYGFNMPSVSIDSSRVNYPIVRGDDSRFERQREELLGALATPGEIERVQVSFEAAENGEQSAADEAAPLGWCNSAAIQLDRSEDSVTVTISAGDPRGAFAFTMRRLRDGSLILHVPTPTSSYLHMPLKQLHDGTYQVGSTGAPSDDDRDD